MTPTQKFILGSARAALKVAGENLPKTASAQELEDYAVALMLGGPPQIKKTSKGST